MAKYLLKDIKSVHQTERLNLKGEVIPTIPTAPSKNKLLDLSSYKKSQSLFTKSTSDRHSHQIENINSLHARPTFFYVPEDKITPPLHFPRFFSTLRFAALGLLIAFSFNLCNVLQNGTRLRSTLIGQASAGFGNILDGTTAVTNKNFQLAESSFAQAKQNFDQSLEKISFLSSSQNSQLSNEKISDSVSHILQAGQALSRAGSLFSLAADDLQNLPTLFVQSNQDFLNKKLAPTTKVTTTTIPTTPDLPATSAPTLTSRLRLDLSKVDLAITQLKDAETQLNQVDSNLLPEKYRNELPSIREKLTKINEFLAQLSTNFPAILNLLGDRYPHRYVILLQNDTEARPTGGFIGSLIIMDIDDGNITRFDFHDVYQYDGQLLENITPPEEIAKITDSWHLRDSNYSPDFAISAEKAAWFLQKSKGPSVDTVIAVNQSVMSDLLKLTGPITVPELKSVLTEENFQFIISYLVESKFYGKTQPKIILEKTIKAFQQKLLKSENWGQFFSLITHEIYQQKIMLYSRDAKVQQFFEFLHLTPHQEQIADQQDYLQVIASSIGGNKSDAFMSQDLKHQTFITQDGTITDELTITRSHNWSDADLLFWQTQLKKFGFNDLPDHLIDLLGRGLNQSSMKVYLPLGTQLENVVGIDPSNVSMRSDSELQKSYLLFTLMTEAGHSSQVTLRYRLPYKIPLLPAGIYRFSAQGQPGLVPTTLEKSTVLPPELSILKSSAPDFTQLTTSFHYTSVISS